MQELLEVMWNTVEYSFKDSWKEAGQLEECCDSKGREIVLNGRTCKYHFGGGRFYMLTQSYKFSHNLCLNNFPQVWFIGNQRDQVYPFRYINWADEVSHLVRGGKLLRDMKYLMRSVKQVAEAVGICIEDNWYVKIVSSGRFNLKRQKIFDSLSWSLVIRYLHTRSDYIIG